MYAIILDILKYTGLIIATLSSVWSATNIVSKETDGKKKLTRAGKISITLTVAGLLISITSNILADQLQSQKTMESSIREIQRTNKIILAGQPLSSLSIELDCNNINPAFIQGMKAADSNARAVQMDQQGETSSSKGSGIQRLYENIPMFLASLTGKRDSSDQHFLLLMSVQDGDAIISYGYLVDSLKLYEEKFNGDTAKLSLRKNKLSKGILFDNFVWGSAYRGGESGITEPYFASDGLSAQLFWYLDPVTLYSCLDKVNPVITVTAKLPDVIKIAILYDFKAMPSKTENLAGLNRFVWTADSTRAAGADDSGTIKLNPIYAKSTLTLVPNKLTDQAVHYKISAIYPKSIIDEEWEEDENCKALLLIYQQIKEQ